jgi:hypothetical protein
MATTPRYWFRAKRYGYGWGLPASWQGWVVLLLYVAGLAAGGALLPENAAGYALLVLVMTVALIGIGYAKGEPPRWRWGR